MASKWIEHVKKYAADNKMSYRDALRCAKCKGEYKSSSGKGLTFSVPVQDEQEIIKKKQKEIERRMPPKIKKLQEDKTKLDAFQFNERWNELSAAEKRKYKKQNISDIRGKAIKITGPPTIPSQRTSRGPKKLIGKPKPKLIIEGEGATQSVVFNNFLVKLVPFQLTTDEYFELDNMFRRGTDEDLTILNQLRELADEYERATNDNLREEIRSQARAILDEIVPTPPSSRYSASSVESGSSSDSIDSNELMELFEGSEGAGYKPLGLRYVARKMHGKGSKPSKVVPVVPEEPEEPELAPNLTREQLIDISKILFTELNNKQVELLALETFSNPDMDKINQVEAEIDFILRKLDTIKQKLRSPDIAGRGMNEVRKFIKDFNKVKFEELDNQQFNDMKKLFNAKYNMLSDEDKRQYKALLRFDTKRKETQIANARNNLTGRFLENSSEPQLLQLMSDAKNISAKIKDKNNARKGVIRTRQLRRKRKAAKEQEKLDEEQEKKIDEGLDILFEDVEQEDNEALEALDYFINNMDEYEGGKIHKNENSYVQSIVFDKSKFDKKSASAWLKKNNYENKGADDKENTLRYRQVDPQYIEKMGFNRFRTKKIGRNSGISLILAYK